MHQQF